MCPVDSHFLKKIILFFIIMLPYNVNIVRLSRPYSIFWMPTCHFLAKSLIIAMWLNGYHVTQFSEIIITQRYFTVSH